MRLGLSMSEMVSELEREEAEKHDYLVPTQRLFLNEEARIIVPETGEFTVSEYALGQMATHLDIPRDYARKLAENSPKLLSQNVNYWLAQKDERRLLRTVGTRFRAYLSDRYRVMDHYPLLSALAPTLEQEQLQIISTNLSPDRMYLKALSPRLKAEVKPGDTVQWGISLSNSEVGAGSLMVKPLLLRLVCQNGMVLDTSQRKYHVGKRLEDYGEYQKYLSSEARRAEEQAFFLALRDTVRGSLRESFFEAQVEKLRETTRQPIRRKVEEVVEVTRKRYSLSETLGTSVLESLIRSSDYSQWGLANAVTFVANSNEVGSYDLSSELEMIGGKIVELSPKDWQTLAG